MLIRGTDGRNAGLDTGECTSFLKNKYFVRIWGENKALKIHEYHSIMNKNAQDIKSIHDRLYQKMGRKQKTLHDMMQS